MSCFFLLIFTHFYYAARAIMIIMIPQETPKKFQEVGKITPDETRATNKAHAGEKEKHTTHNTQKPPPRRHTLTHRRAAPRQRHYPPDCPTKNEKWAVGRHGAGTRKDATYRHHFRAHARPVASLPGPSVAATAHWVPLPTPLTNPLRRVRGCPPCRSTSCGTGPQ